MHEMWKKPQSIKEILVETMSHFETEYPNSFKFKGTRRPYIKRELFRSQLTKLQEELITESSNELIQKIDYINSRYSAQDPDYFPSKGKTSNGNILNTFENDNCLYLGMVSEEWVKHCINGDIPVEIPNSNFKAIRAKVWYKYMGNVAKGKCYCCKFNEITTFNFEAGHVTSAADGGSDELSNLRPICQPCNRSMGKMNMDDYIEKYY